VSARGSNPAPALVLFDIDGTLIRRAGPHHRAALEKAVRRVTGFAASLDGVDCSGKLDCDLIRGLLAAGGAQRCDGRVPAIMRAAENTYVRSCPDLQHKICPGVRALLARLYRLGIPAGLVTGNLPRIAWHKMRRAGIAQYFRFGTFAGMAPDRAALVELAIRQAHRSGWITPHAHVTLIGDHRNDITAAKLNGIQSVAVATGVSSREDLEASGPDFLLPDLRALRLEMLLL
jgi:phosphoglycolate phosphatase-like HAD superfamily hydrolase